jgi:hypothetical protein
MNPIAERLRRRLPAAVIVGQAIGVVACAIELRGAPPAPAAVVALGLGLALGALGGVVGALLSAPWSSRPGLAGLIAGALAAALWIGGHGGAVLGVTVAFHDPHLMALLMVAAGAVLLVPAAIVFVLARRGLRWIGRLRPLAWLGARVDRGVARAIATAARAGALVATRRRLAIWAATWTALAAAALSPLGDDWRIRRGAIVPATIGGLRPLLDRDGDGFLAVLGDGDCAEGDRARSPRGVEIEEDGVDQDCRFGDLDGWPAPPPAGAPAASTVVLVTLGGADRDLDLLPDFAARLAAGRRFTAAVGLDGPLRQVAPVLLGGRLEGHDGGFAADGSSLAQRAADAGWKVGMAANVDLSRQTTIFPTDRTLFEKKEPASAVKRGVRYLDGERAFVWVHVDVKKKSAKALDGALVQLVEKAAQRGSHRILVVALGPDKPGKPAAKPPGGGPLAILGDGAGEVAAPVGLFDVYPTLRGWLGLDEPAGEGARPPAPGRDLSGEPDGAALGGWLGAAGERLIAVDAAGVIRHDPARRRFVVDGREVAEDAREPRLAPLRDGHLAAWLRAKNLRAAGGVLRAAPDDLVGKTATIAGALDVLGCALRDREDGRVEVTIYLRGGEHLAPGDLIEIMLKSTGIRLFAVEPPLGGALRFGRWPAGAVVAHPVVFDRRYLGTDDPVVWFSVMRGKKRLPATRGEGSYSDAVPICVVER